MKIELIRRLKVIVVLQLQASFSTTDRLQASLKNFTQPIN